MESIIPSLVIGYLLGAIPFSLIVAKVTKGIDLRQHGSGNLGAANTFRTLGPGPGVAVLLLDAGKGVASVEIASALWRSSSAIGKTDLMLLAGLAAIAGHIWTVFASFKGGKGVATAAGVFAAIAPAAFLVSAGVWLAAVALSRYISLGSVLAAVTLPVAVYLTRAREAQGWQRILIVSVLVAAIVVARHRINILRILCGIERKFSLRGGQ